MEKTLFMRICNADGCSYGGFQWPLEVGAEVEAPDWSPDPVCGGGLHGLPWGVGDGGLLDWSDEAKALVFSASDEVVDIDGAKSKVRRAKVEAVFDTIAEAAAFIADNGGRGYAVTGIVLAQESGDPMTGGYGATMTGGDGATMTGGDRATMTGGDGATMTGGYRALLLISRWDGERTRVSVGYIGETKDVDGNVLEPGTAYRLNDEGEFIKADGSRG